MDDRSLSDSETTSGWKTRLIALLIECSTEDLPTVCEQILAEESQLDTRKQRYTESPASIIQSTSKTDRQRHFQLANNLRDLSNVFLSKQAVKQATVLQELACQIFEELSLPQELASTLSRLSPMYQGQRMTSEAIRTLERAAQIYFQLDQAPEYADVLCSAGQLYAAQSEWTKAEQAYARAFAFLDPHQLKPKTLHGLLRYGKLLMTKLAFAEALEVFTLCKTQSDTRSTQNIYIEALHQLANVQLLADDPRATIRSCREALGKTQEVTLKLSLADLVTRAGARLYADHCSEDAVTAFELSASVFHDCDATERLADVLDLLCTARSKYSESITIVQTLADRVKLVTANMVRGVTALTKLAKAQFRLGNLAEALHTVTDNLQRCKALPLSPEILLVSKLNCEILYKQGKLEEACVVIQNTLRDCELLEFRKAQISLVKLLGHAVLRLGLTTEAVDYYREGLRLAGLYNYPSKQCSLLWAFSQISSQQDEWIGFASYVSECLANCKLSGKPQKVAKALYLLADLKTRTNQLHKAKSLTKECQALAREHYMEKVLMKVLLLEGKIRIQETIWNEAVNPLQEALEIGRRNGDKEWIVKTLNCLGLTHMKLEEYDKAFVYYAESLFISSHHLDTLYNLATVCFSLKQYSEAVAYYEQIADRYRNEGNLPKLAQVLECLSKVFRKSNKPEQALRTCYDAAGIYEALEQHESQVHVLLIAAKLYVDDKTHHPQKLGFLERIVEDCYKIGNLQLVAKAVYLIGRLYLASNETILATGAFSGSARLFQQTGHSKRCADALASLAECLETRGLCLQATAKWEEAAKVAEESERSAVRDKALRKLGVLTCRSKQYEKSLAFFKRSRCADILQELGDAETMFSFGKSCLKTGCADEALEKLAYAIELLHQNTQSELLQNSLYCYSKALLETGEVAKSESKVEECLQLVSSGTKMEFKLKLVLVDCLIRLNKYASAETLCQECLSLNQKFAVHGNRVAIYTKLALIYYKTHEYSRVIEVSKECFVLSSYFPSHNLAELEYVLAKAYSQLNSSAKAKTMLDRCVNSLKGQPRTELLSKTQRRLYKLESTQISESQTHSEQYEEASDDSLLVLQPTYIMKASESLGQDSYSVSSVSVATAKAHQNDLSRASFELSSSTVLSCSKVMFAIGQVPSIQAKGIPKHVRCVTVPSPPPLESLLQQRKKKPRLSTNRKRVRTEGESDNCG